MPNSSVNFITLNSVSLALFYIALRSHKTTHTETHIRNRAHENRNSQASKQTVVVIAIIESHCFRYGCLDLATTILIHTSM